MTERPKLKLDNPGDEAVMLVKYVNAFKTKFGPKIVFVGTVRGQEAETPLIAEDTADKRLERIGLTRETAVGETLKFWRKENPNGRAFWEIDVAHRSETAPQAASPRVQSPYVPPRETAPPRGVSAGPRIPDMDGPPDWSDVPVPDAEPEPYRADPPLTPREERERATPQDAKREAFMDLYLAVYRNMLVGMATAHTEPFMGERVPLTAEAVQAATATCIIQMDRKGLLP